MPVVSATEKAHMARMLKGTVTHQLSRRMRARRIAQTTNGKQQQTDIGSGHLLKQPHRKGVVHPPSKIVQVAILEIEKPEGGETKKREQP